MADDQIDPYAKLLEFIPKSVQPMMRGVADLQQAKRQAQADAMAQQAAAIQEQRAQTLAGIDKAVSRLPPEALTYGAVRYDIDRDRAFADYQAELGNLQLKVQGKDPAAAESFLKSQQGLLEKRYGEKLKQFDQGETYKNAKENFQKMTTPHRTLITLGEQATTMRNLMDNGAVDKARSYGKATVAKTLNSILSPDALQLGEFIGRYETLLTASEMSMLNGRGPFDPRAIAFKVFGMPDKEKENFIKTFTERAFNADPSQFLQDAMQTHDDSARAHNKVLQEQVINPTSPRVAASLGAIPVKMLMEAAPAPQQAPMPQSAPQATQVINSATGVQPGTSQPQQIPSTRPPSAVRFKHDLNTIK